MNLLISTVGKYSGLQMEFCLLYYTCCTCLPKSLLIDENWHLRRISDSLISSLTIYFFSFYRRIMFSPLPFDRTWIKGNGKFPAIICAWKFYYDRVIVRKRFLILEFFHPSIVQRFRATRSNVFLYSLVFHPHCRTIFEEEKRKKEENILQLFLNLARNCVKHEWNCNFTAKNTVSSVCYNFQDTEVARERERES